MKKVLVATPIRNGTDSNYIRSLIASLRADLPGYQLEFEVVGNTYVSFARNNLACYAVDHGFDEILWIDDDMLYSVDHVRRILSHSDSYVVGGIYCKRKPGEPEWLFVPHPDAKPLPDGRLECTGLATGFLRTPVSLLKHIQARFPDRRYLHRDPKTGRDTHLFEFFPMGIVGPGTPEGRLESIKYLLADESSTLKANDLLSQIREAAFGVREPGVIRGEDYYFCRIARKAGVQLYVDLGMPPVPHIGSVAFPITPEMVGWRNDAQNEFKIPAGEM